MAGIAPVGVEFLVNQTTVGSQQRPDLAFLNDGRAVFVWHSASGDAAAGVYARVAGPRGEWTTNEFAIATSGAGAQGPLVAADTANTGFIVAWQTGSSTTAVKTQYFTEANTPRADPVTVASGLYQLSGSIVSLTELAGRAGGALVGVHTDVYLRFGGSTSTDNVLISSPDGTPPSVWATTASDPSISEAINTQGLVWISSGPTVTKHHFASGAVLDTYTVAGSGAESVVAALPGGRAAVAWSQGGQILFSVVGAGGATNVFTANAGPGGARYDPAIAGLADGRFVVGWTDATIPGDSNVHGRVFNADGTPATAEFVFGSYTMGDQSEVSLAASRYGGFAVTWQSEDPRDLGAADGSGAAVKGAFYEVVDYRQERFAGADTVVGTGGADSLGGGAGDDVLYGGPGFDILVGGTGADKFLLSTDGSVDRILDFSAAEGDHLLLLDANGLIVDGSHGLLIWDQNNNYIAWDPDSDGGPAFQTVVGAAFGPEGLLARANLSAGFQPSAIRVITPGGGRVETLLDWGSERFDRSVATYDAAARLTEHDVFYDDGSYSFRWLNEPNTAVRYAEYDAQNRLTLYATETYLGDRKTFTFDPAGVKAYSREVYEYAPGTALKYYGVVWDDGSRSERFFDYDNSKPYSHIIEDYDAIGRLIGRATYGDDGSVILG